MSDTDVLRESYSFGFIFAAKEENRYDSTATQMGERVCQSKELPIGVRELLILYFCKAKQSRE